MRTRGILVTGQLTLMLLLAGIACRSVKNDPTGLILVGTPEVSTRERLVNDRLTQDHWLRDQLKASDDVSFEDFQGLLDERALTALSINASVNADPNQLALYDANSASRLEQIKQSNELAALDHQIQVLQKKKKIADLQQQNTAPAAGGGGTADTGEDTNEDAGNTQPSTDPARPSSPAKDLASDLLDRLADPARADLLPDPSKIVTTKAKSSPIETLRDRLAYREEIRNEILENQLDDRHDLGGNTLYRLNLDATLLPSKHNDSWAIVDVEVEHMDKRYTSDLYDDWTRSFRIHFEREIGSQFVRTLRCLGDLTAENPPATKCGLEFADMEELLSYGNTAFELVETTEAYSPRFTYENQVRADLIGLLRSMIKDEEKKKDRPSLERALLELIAEKVKTDYFERGRFDRYLAAPVIVHSNPKLIVMNIGRRATSCGSTLRSNKLVTWCESKDDLGGPEPGSRQYDCATDKRLSEAREAAVRATEARTAEAHADELRAASASADDIRAAEARVAETRAAEIKAQKQRDLREIQFECALGYPNVYAYSATPKDSVQRISRVAAARNTMELAAAISALTGSASFDVAAAYIRDNQQLMHTILREPLVVGYTEAGDEPGEDKFATVLQKARFGWLIGPRFGLQTKSFGRQTSITDHRPIQNALAAAISFPGWSRRAIVTIKTCWRSKPSITGKSDARCPADSTTDVRTHPVEIPGRIEAINDLLMSRSAPLTLGWQQYEVVSGSPAALLIKGTNLWRSTEVTLGAQTADEIRVLPDMAGIIARFQKVKEPASLDSTGPRTVDVNIWTSGGNQQVGEAKIYPPKRAEESWKLAWTQTRAVKDEEISVELVEGTLPSSFAKMELAIEGLDTAKGKWTEPIRLPAATKAADGKVIVAKLTDAGNLLVNAMDIRASVWIQSRPDSGVVDIKETIDKAIVYYASANDAKIMTTPGNLKSGNKLTLTFPKRVSEGFPGFSKPTLVPTATPAAANLTVTMTPAPPDWKTAAEPYTLETVVTINGTFVAATNAKLVLALTPLPDGLVLDRTVIDLTP